MTNKKQVVFCKRAICEYSKLDEDWKKHLCIKRFVHIDKRGYCETAGYFYEKLEEEDK